MKLQFSLATLLVCMTVLAVVCAVAIRLKVHQPELISDIIINAGTTNEILVTPAIDRPPTPAEVAVRLAILGPLAIAATLAVLWAIRRLKSRRENGPPDG